VLLDGVVVGGGGVVVVVVGGGVVVVTGGGCSVGCCGVLFAGDVVVGLLVADVEGSLLVDVADVLVFGCELVGMTEVASSEVSSWAATPIWGAFDCPAGALCSTAMVAMAATMVATITPAAAVITLADCRARISDTLGVRISR